MSTEAILHRVIRRRRRRLLFWAYCGGVSTGHSDDKRESWRRHLSSAAKENAPLRLEEFRAEVRRYLTEVAHRWPPEKKRVRNHAHLVPFSSSKRYAFWAHCHSDRELSFPRPPTPTPSTRRGLLYLRPEEVRPNPRNPDARAFHPTVKPIGLVADAMLDVTRRGDVVLDPFLGSGTTILAAERTGRCGRGIELDPLYVDTAILRWQQRTGGRAHLACGQMFAEASAARRSA